MQNMDQFDVLVVYSEAIAQSASQKYAVFPFDPYSRRANYNDAYAYFLKYCARKSLKAAFATSADIVGAGKCSSYWTYKNNFWVKTDRLCSSKQIFDKFSPVNKDQTIKRKLFFSSSEVKPFNDKDLFQVFFDKYKTYLQLKTFSIPTVVVKNANVETIDKALKKLEELIKKIDKEDFTEDIVIKDRFGAGGNNIYKIKADYAKEIQKIVKKKKKVSFVAQPFLKFDKGLAPKKFSGFIDIRLIYHNGNIVQTYIRAAKENDFRCNEHQGGTLTYVSKRRIPQRVLKLSLKVAKKLNKKHALFALDFIVTNNNKVYLLEGNTGPGIDWNLLKKVNEKRAKLFIRAIVKDLAQTIHKSKAKIVKPTNCLEKCDAILTPIGVTRFPIQ
ncbi:MAG TPA: hypothetical protein DDZ05_02700 [Candidatus Blackburnbacteria bacterium]|nr:hypothetical protein [Candidatus Blackburnbacteria bacterium]